MCIFRFHWKNQLGCSRLALPLALFYFQLAIVLKLEIFCRWWSFYIEKRGNSYWFPLIGGCMFLGLGSDSVYNYLRIHFKWFIRVSRTHGGCSFICDIFGFIQPGRRDFRHKLQVSKWSRLVHFLTKPKDTSRLTPNEIEWLLFFSGLI